MATPRHQHPSVQFLEFADTLPEAQESVLVEFFNTVRQASSLAEINVAAGIAYGRLTGETA